MDVTTSGRFRVLESPRRADERLLLDVDDADPTYVPATGYDPDLQAVVDDLEPGNVVEATVGWRDGDPRFESVEVVDRTRFTFVPSATGIFEAAREVWRDAERTGDPMNSTVTYSTDGDPNGVVYVFAKQPGARNLYDEFRSGVKPLDPLLARLDDYDDEARDVFVLRPDDEPFVVVAIALRRGSILAATLRDTYDPVDPFEG